MRSKGLLTVTLTVLALAGCSDDPASIATPGTVSGIVRGPGGAAATDVTVALQSLQSSDGLYRVTLAITDANGVYSFANVAPGDYVVSARALAPANEVAAARIHIPMVHNRPVDLLLRAPGVVVGRASLSNATDHTDIMISSKSTLAFIGTDAAGNYRLEGLPPGRWSVVANYPGYATSTVEVTISAPGAEVAAPDLVLDPY